MQFLRDGTVCQDSGGQLLFPRRHGVADHRQMRGVKGRGIGPGGEDVLIVPQGGPVRDAEVLPLP